MTQDIEFGPAIEVNGKRPAWLADGDWQCIAILNDGEVQGPTADTMRNTRDWVWRQISSIRLPVDHPAYLAIEKGFEPWSGGEKAPEDWDGGEVLLSDPVGVMPSVANAVQWTRNSKHYRPIIGYRRKPNPLPADDTVVVKRMTDTDIANLQREWNESPCTTFAAATWFAVRLGVYAKEETPAERFTRDTGLEATPEIQKAIEWAMEKGR